MGGEAGSTLASRPFFEPVRITPLALALCNTVCFFFLGLLTKRRWGVRAPVCVPVTRRAVCGRGAKALVQDGRKKGVRNRDGSAAGCVQVCSSLFVAHPALAHTHTGCRDIKTGHVSCGPLPRVDVRLGRVRQKSVSSHHRPLGSTFNAGLTLSRQARRHWITGQNEEKHPKREDKFCVMYFSARQ